MKAGRFDGEEGECSTPLMFPVHGKISLRKQPRPPLDTTLTVSDLEDTAMPGAHMEAHFLMGHTRVLARLTSSGLVLIPVRRRWCRPCRRPPVHVPFSEILSAAPLEQLPLLARLLRWLRSRRGGGVALAVHSLRRGRRGPAAWRYWRLVLVSEDPALARGWAAEINALVRAAAQSRPARVLAVINPEGGRRRAGKVWAKTAQPLLHLAGVECVALTTEHAGHAHELIANMALEELESYEGVLAVGGDGLFQELVQGLLALRRGGGRRAAVAEGLRVAQIPGGSTDAVAWSLNGSRCAEAAALHVALGDGGSLDVARVDSCDGRSQPSVCYAAYGYMGDLLAASERLRWLGPARYAVAGALTFLAGRAYGARVAYLPAPPPGPSAERDSVCGAGCEVCAAGVVVAQSQQDFALPAAAAFRGRAPTELQGEFRSLMVVVTPCRSDLSPHGLSPGSHLADGRLRLILVRRCSRLQYLGFLASIPRSGIQPGRFDFVEILEATAVRVTPVGQQSVWNVDGELLQCDRLEAACHRGLLRTFSRGPPLA